ncbi:glycosyltransferase [Moorena sp. SIO3I6]|uniref:glycosyltransferase n=1 Tax=Moorena sp. SIO3I6 TaxID=2607831 RepID=UPI0013FC2671|nr:glycosyltransferase [Moorena sp. SIO3I6]NEP22345.1 glycosyltransferase [Moorena sp. SIO3I6]
MISLVTTVLNDRVGCIDFFEQMQVQTLLPDEIVIVDGGSQDGTWELLQAQAKQLPNLKVFQEKGCNVARGRNLAVRAAKHDLIVSTDIGCRWDREWLEELVQPMLKDPEVEAVMGSWRVSWSDQKTPWAQADPLLLGGLEFRATPQSHASSRSIAYRKSFYLGLGGLPEDLTLAADDMVLALLIQRSGKRLEASPEPRCQWLRPQTLTAISKEARRNFRGAGEAGIWLNYFVSNVLRFTAETIALMGFLIALVIVSDLLKFVFGVMLLLLFLLRLRNWLRHYMSVKERGGIVGLWHVAILDISTRWSAINGYWEGLLRGKTQCQETRQKLRGAGIGW